MATNHLQDGQTLALVVAAVVLIGSGLTSLALGAESMEIALGVGGGVVAAGIVGGTYMLGRRFGHPQSHAVAEAAVAFGVLFLMGVSFQLLYRHGNATDPSAVTVGGGLVLALAGTLVVVGLIAALERVGPSPN